MLGDLNVGTSRYGDGGGNIFVPTRLFDFINMSIHSLVKNKNSTIVVIRVIFCTCFSFSKTIVSKRLHANVPTVVISNDEIVSHLYFLLHCPIF